MGGPAPGELIARDAIHASGIPLDTPVVIGYGDGAISQWTSSDWARFPAGTPQLSIVTSAWDSGDILDVERFDAIPTDVPGWVRRFKRPGRRRPTVYANRETWPAVLEALAAANLPADAVDWWAATLDGTMLVAGAVAVQYISTGPYDESVILDPTWVGMEAHMTFSLGFRVGLAHAIIAAVYNREPTNQEEQDLANTINADGSNLADLVQQLSANLSHPDAVAIQPTTLAAQVAQLSAGTELVAHHHEGGPTGPAVPG